MKFSPTRVINLIVFCIVLILSYSCNKDSDLFADYVTGENAGTSGNLIDLENGTIVTREDKMVAINILRDDQSGIKRKSVVLKKVTQPKNGKTEIKTDSTLVYTPDKDFTGKDDIVYTVEETTPDNTKVEKESTVVVKVNPQLDVKEDKAKTEADKKVDIDVLKNDTYSDKNNASVSSTTTPSKGTVAINKDNTLTYTPNADAKGTDTFTYTATVENSEKTASTMEEATVTVDIVGDNNISMGNELLAFPGAVGHGRFTTGGRGGSVYQVTNLNDDGPGSLRDAISKGNRTVVFRVGGVIKIKSILRFGGDNITIAGQTAPGGIAVYGTMTGTNNHENIIIRYVNFICGDAGRMGEDGTFRILKLTPGTASNFIFDHCGFFWGKDETFATAASNDETSSINNVTIQRSIIAQGFDNKGLILWRQSYNISIINNLFANNPERNIRASTRHSTFEQINNVFTGYDWATQPSYANEFDVIGNYYQSSGSSNIIDLIAVSEANKPFGDIAETKAYVSDNRKNGSPNSSMTSNLNPYLKESRQVSSGYVPIASSSVLSNITSDVGANKNGNNNLAQLQINDALNGTKHIINKESDGVAISIKGGAPAYTDEDKDGMDDNWELANGLNPNDPNDGKKAVSAKAGYTNLEIFLHHLTL